MAPLLPAPPGIPGRLGSLMVPLLPVPPGVPGRLGSFIVPLLPVPPGIPGRLGSLMVPLLPVPPGAPEPVVPLPELPVPPAPPVCAKTNVAVMQSTAKVRMSIFVDVRYIIVSFEFSLVALIGFQGRGCADGVRPAFCHALILEALIFQ